MIKVREPEPVTKKVTMRPPVTASVTFEVCPTCGHKLKALTPAEKQRAYRARKKARQ